MLYLIEDSVVLVPLRPQVAYTLLQRRLSGAGRRTRTLDFLLPKQALYQTELYPRFLIRKPTNLMFESVRRCPTLGLTAADTLIDKAVGFLIPSSKAPILDSFSITLNQARG